MFDRLDDYVIEEVEMRNGSTRRYIHNEAEGNPCYIELCEMGTGACIAIHDLEEQRHWRLRTSTVMDIHEADDRNSADITTRNSVYHLRRVNFEDGSFAGLKGKGYMV